MLRNLQEAYLRRSDFAHSVATLDLMLEGAPREGSWYKLRGVLSIELKRFQAARSDLETYLSIAPEAADRDAVLKQLEAIHRWLGQVN